MLKSEAISNFLSVASSPLAKLYNPEMETQVMVWKGDGNLKRDSEKEIFYVDGNKSWKPFRIPNDGEITFDLNFHAEGIGMSGWNYVKKESLWVGFDFDSIVNHKTGLNAENLQSVIIEANRIDYINIYKSTSGKGLHLYIFFDKPIPTIDRAEHQALAQAMLSFLTADSGFDFNATVDCLGMILWVWHRRQEGTDGLTLIKEGVKFNSDKVPENWKKYLNEKREVTKMRYSPEMENLINSNQLKVLTDNQKALLKWFTKNSRKNWWYDTDAKMLVCHTFDLQSAHEELHMKGKFATDSSGSSEQNCFCFPYKSDGWVIRRYGKHVKENPLWEIDELGWTKTYLNIELSFRQSALYRGAVVNSKGDYIISGLKLRDILQDLNIPTPKNEVEGQVELSLKQQGIIIKTEDQVDGWIRNKKGSEKVISYREEERNEESTELYFLDDMIRHCIVDNHELGWFLNTNSEWVSQSPSNIPKVIQFKFNDINNKSLNINQGMCIMNPWKIVCEPFKPEYIGNRTWNKNAPQFAITPEIGNFETWSMILEHLSHEFKPEDNQWCKDNCIITGHDFLLFWIAFMFQRPEISLPYLFFWGEQNTGKSTLHENLQMFFKNGMGYVRADHTLKSQSGFNGELQGSVLCVVEETNLRTNHKAYNMIKDFVTSTQLSIRALYQEPILVPNTTHWIQCANEPDACPIIEGDTRIISACVPMIEKEIPKGELNRRLRKEAPAFLYKCLNLELPLPYSRLALPVLDTQSKKLIQKTNSREPLDMFIQQRCYLRFGREVSLSDFYNRFDMWLNSSFSKEKELYTKQRTTLLLLQKYPYFPKGRNGSYTMIGNISFSSEVGHNHFKFSEKDGKLIQLEITERDRKILQDFNLIKEMQ